MSDLLTLLIAFCMNNGELVSIAVSSSDCSPEPGKVEFSRLSLNIWTPEDV